METEQLNRKSHYYIDAFRRKDRETLSEMMAEDIQQIEPGKHLIGKTQILNFIDDMEKIDFVMTRVFSDPVSQFSAIEFEVTTPDERKFRGCDHLKWNTEEKIELIEAFLYEVIC